MEDGVTEVHSLFPPPNHNPEEGSKRKYNEENEEGFVSTEKAEKVKQKGLDIDEAKDSSSGGGGGGVISNFISNFMTPLSPRTGKVTTEDESGNEVFEKEEEIGNNGGEKGVISNLVSNFFHRNESEEGVVETEKKEKEDDEEMKGGEKIKRLKTDQTEANGGKSGGGGLIHDIVSHLPTSIPDDAAPTADEATILINSLVRD